MSQPGIGSAAFGAAAVHLAVSELLGRGHRVAVPVVDDDGVDLVVDYRTTVQVKSSSHHRVEPTPGYVYSAFKWFLSGKNRSADVFLLHACGVERDRWFVVPGSEIRVAGSTIAIYDTPRIGRCTISATCESFEDRWDLFAQTTSMAGFGPGEEFA